MCARPARSPDEIGTLGRSLNVMAGRLREKIDDLEREQAKREAILDGMVEGVIADRRARPHHPHQRARAARSSGWERPGSSGRPLLEVMRNVNLHDVLVAGRDAWTRAS